MKKTVISTLISVVFMLCFVQQNTANNTFNSNFHSKEYESNYRDILQSDMYDDQNEKLILINCRVGVSISFENGTTITGTIIVYGIPMFQCAALKTYSLLN